MNAAWFLIVCDPATGTGVAAGPTNGEAELTSPPVNSGATVPPAVAGGRIGDSGVNSGTDWSARLATGCLAEAAAQAGQRSRTGCRPESPVRPAADTTSASATSLPHWSQMTTCRSAIHAS